MVTLPLHQVSVGHSAIIFSCLRILMCLTTPHFQTNTAMGTPTGAEIFTATLCVRV